MRLFHGTDNAEIQRPTVLTLGVFDGLHLGHQLIMRTVVERARETGAVPTVITFDPHPRAVLHPESAPPLLQTLDQKVEGFGVLGIEQTIVIRFDEEFSQTPAEEFLCDVVKERLHAKEVYLGRGFAFGHNREGNIELLRRVSQQLGFFADEVPEVQLRNQRVSSSRVRGLLAEGKVNLARRLLARPYGVEGRVERGAERGSTLGFPTANLIPEPHKLLPTNGVYAVRVQNISASDSISSSPVYNGVANIGVRPTFNGTVRLVEVHLLDIQPDLYDQRITINFIARLRNEQRFAGIEALKAQIAMDVQQSRHVLEL